MLGWGGVTAAEACLSGVSALAGQLPPVGGSTIPRFTSEMGFSSTAVSCPWLPKPPPPHNLLWAKDQVLDSWQAEAELATDGRQQGKHSLCPLPMRTWGNWCQWNGAWCQDRVTGHTVRIPVGQVEGGCFLETWVVGDSSLKKNQYYQNFPRAWLHLSPQSWPPAQCSVWHVAHGTAVSFQAFHHHSILNPFNWVFSSYRLA